MRIFNYDDFLKEEKEHFSHYVGKGRSQNLDHLFNLDSIEQLINKYAPYFLEDENIDTTVGESEFIRLYRGVKVKGNVYLLKPSLHQRVSRNTENYYTNIIDDTWEGFPKRSKSVICSTSEAKAKGYGKSFRVIPLNKDALLAICPKGDIWTSFNDGIADLNDEFSEFFQYVYGHPGLPNKLDDFNTFLKDAFGLDDEETAESLKEKLTVHNFVDRNSSILYGSEDGEEDLTEVNKLEEISKDGNLYHIFAKALSPQLNGFKAINFSDTKRKDYSLEREVWTESDCLMIESEAFDKWLQSKFKVPTVDKFGWTIKDGMSTDPRLKTDEERRKRVEDSK